MLDQQQATALGPSFAMIVSGGRTMPVPGAECPPADDEITRDDNDMLGLGMRVGWQDSAGLAAEHHGSRIPQSLDLDAREERLPVAFVAGDRNLAGKLSAFLRDCTGNTIEQVGGRGQPFQRGRLLAPNSLPTP